MGEFSRKKRGARSTYTRPASKRDDRAYSVITLKLTSDPVAKYRRKRRASDYSNVEVTISNRLWLPIFADLLKEILEGRLRFETQKNNFDNPDEYVIGARRMG